MHPPDQQSSHDLGDVVMVPVPRALLSAVYEFLAIEMKVSRPDPGELVGLDDEVLAPFEVTCVYCHGPAFQGSNIGYQCGQCGLAFQGIEVDRDNGTWTPSMIATLRSELGTEGTLATVLDQIARKSPHSVGSEDLARAAGVDAYHLRAELAALSKAARRLFGKKIWPMSAKQGWGTGDRMGYRMAEDVADWWLKSQGG